MKTKIYTVLAALAMAAMVSAQTFNRIVVNIEKGGDEDELYLIESPSFTDEFENSYDEVKGFIGNSVYVYGTTAYGSQSMVCTNSLQGAYIGYRATAAGSATISFSGLQSDLADVTTYYLLDTENGQATQIGASASYNFTAEAGDHPNRFMIVEPVKVTTNEDGWASFANKVALAPLGGLKAYFAEYKAAEGVAELHETAMIPAATGAFLYGTALTEYTLTPAVSGLTASTETNNLVGCVNYTDVTSVSASIYCIRNVNGVSALYEYVGNNIPAGKAYLPVAVTPSSPAPQRIRMVINGAQGVENVGVDAKAQKFIGEDGQIYLRRGNEVYNLQGQIVK